MAFLLSLALAAAPLASDMTLIPGALTPGRQPDGNSILMDAPQGLILIDTGRHKEQQEKILAAARTRGKPIAAIVNTHWHLDHSGGNAEIRAAFPRVPLYGSEAIEGALAGFLRKSREGAQAYIDSGKATPEIKADIALDMAAMDDATDLKPNRPILGSSKMEIAGRKLGVHLARFAATEGDVWLFDPKTRTVIAGDLVVGPAPFLDTACAEGWRAALGEIAKVKFTTLIPGHGDPMSRAEFLSWKRAFDNLLDCANGKDTKEVCIAGWKKDAAAFIPAGETRTDNLIGYYIDSRLRGPEEERLRYCRPQ